MDQRARGVLGSVRGVGLDECGVKVGVRESDPSSSRAFVGWEHAGIARTGRRRMNATGLSMSFDIRVDDRGSSKSGTLSFE